MTQNETSLYEMPADRMVFTHQGLGEGRELGEMEIVSTIWGKARVQPVNKQGMSGWAWLLSALAVLGMIVAAWILLAGRGTGGSEPTLLTTPEQPATTAQPIPAVQNTPDIHPAPPTSVPAPAVVKVPELTKPVQPANIKPSVTAEKSPATAGEKRPTASTTTNRDVPGEAHFTAQSSGAEKPGKSSATTTSPPASTTTLSGQARQSGLVKQSDPVNAGDSTTSVSTKSAPPKADPSQITQPAKSEPAIKPDTTDTHP